ncbi:hypothetical protein IJD44_06950 [bacterium]|nr:hypothetical protein [bacterium]
MSIQCVAVNDSHKNNSGKYMGAGLGAAAGFAYNVHDANKILEYVRPRLDKIQKVCPQMTGTYKDVFQSYLKQDTKTGKQGIIFLKEKAQIAKRAGLIGGIVIGGAMIGLALGAVIDKIRDSIASKKQNV